MGLSLFIGQVRGTVNTTDGIKCLKCCLLGVFVRVVYKEFTTTVVLLFRPTASAGSVKHQSKLATKNKAAPIRDGTMNEDIILSCWHNFGRMVKTAQYSIRL